MDVRGKPPPSDDACFENMTRTIFLADLSWKMIDEKCPNIKKAFNDFSVDKVAEFSENNVERLISDAGIVRNRAKILATANNARQLQKVRKEYGLLRSYIDKSSNFALVTRELGKRFSRLRPSSTRIFPYSVGENIRRPQE